MCQDSHDHKGEKAHALAVYSLSTSDEFAILMSQANEKFHDCTIKLIKTLSKSHDDGYGTHCIAVKLMDTYIPR